MEPEYYVLNPEEYGIIHSGVPGQEPGNRNGPPYPLSDAIRRMLSERQKAKEEAKKKEAEKKKIKLSEIFNSNNPELIYKYRKYFTDEDIRNKLSRLKNEAELKGYANKAYESKHRLQLKIKKMLADQAARFGQQYLDTYTKNLANRIVSYTR